MASVILLGLENDLAQSLTTLLRRLSHDVTVTNSLTQSLGDRRARVVFAGGDGPDYREIVRKLTAERPDAAVIVVNRLPDNTRWLDALELGAADYCGAPFESNQINWLMTGALRGLAGAVA